MGSIIFLICFIIAMIVAVIGALGFLLFKIMPLSFKLAKIRLKKAEEYVAQHEKKEQEDLKRSPTGWIWDEEQQVWVHPDQYQKWKAAQQEAQTSNEINYKESYQAKRLLTQNEWQNYKTLRDAARIKNYVICPKVRLQDIIEPRKGANKYKTLFYKIQAKHVDFVICDQYMDIKAIIELDDNSHNNQSRMARDEFVDLILKSVGYKIIHTRYITPDILDGI